MILLRSNRNVQIRIFMTKFVVPIDHFFVCLKKQNHFMRSGG
jgi:hypothetical protein